MRHPGVQWRHLLAVDGRSQGQFARAVDISEKHLSQILTGKVMPSVKLVIRMSHELRLEPKEMWLAQARFVLQRALEDQ